MTARPIAASVSKNENLQNVDNIRGGLLMRCRGGTADTVGRVYGGPPVSRPPEGTRSPGRMAASDSGRNAKLRPPPL